MAIMDSAWIKTLEFFKSSVRSVTVIFILSTLLLWLPVWLGRWTPSAIMVWRSSYFVWLVGAFAVSSVWLATYPLEWVLVRPIKRALVKRELHRLSADQKETLRVFISRDHSTVCFGDKFPGPANLMRLGVLRLEKESHGLLYEQGWPYYSIEPWVLAYLKKHRMLVCE